MSGSDVFLLDISCDTCLLLWLKSDRTGEEFQTWGCCDHMLDPNTLLQGYNKMTEQTTRERFLREKR